MLPGGEEADLSTIHQADAPTGEGQPPEPIAAAGQLRSE